MVYFLILCAVIIGIWIIISYWWFFMILLIAIAVIIYNIRQSEFKSKKILLEKYKNFSGIIVDSNIWLGDKYEALFIFLFEIDKLLIIPKEVLEEIEKKKKKGEHNGREAIRRVEKFSKNNKLLIEDVTIDMLYERDCGYADPKIINIILKRRSCDKLLIITDDQKLKIIGRQVLTNKGYSNAIFISGDEYLSV